MCCTNVLITVLLYVTEIVFVELNVDNADVVICL